MTALATLYDRDSIARARAERDREREEITRQTGIRFCGDLMIPPPRAYLIKCPRCRFHAAARTEGRAINSLAGHLVLHAQIGREA